MDQKTSKCEGRPGEKSWRFVKPVRRERKEDMQKSREPGEVLVMVTSAGKTSEDGDETISNCSASVHKQVGEEDL